MGPAPTSSHCTTTSKSFPFAEVADWQDRLEDLAVRAERERWDYMTVPQQHPLPVLDSYVRHTLARVHELGRVAEVSDRACFNTGLLTPGQEEIFGVFSVREEYDATLPTSRANKKWAFRSWARSGDRILTVFRALPEMASYWSDPGELVLVRPSTSSRTSTTSSGTTSIGSQWSLEVG